LKRGGAEKHVLDLAARIDRRKFVPCVVSTAGSGPLERDFEALDVPVHVLEYKGISLKPGIAGPLFREARTFFRDFTAILETRKVAIVHAYLPAANILGMAASSLSGNRVKIVSKRAISRYKTGHPVYSLLENLANLVADAIMVNSRAVAEDIRRTERFLGKKIVLVYNGIEPAEERPIGTTPAPPADLGLPPETVLIPYVAHIREDKAHLCLVDAMREISAAFPSARFLFVGEERKEAEEVRRRIDTLGLKEAIVIAGHREDVPEILRASRLVAHPGETEGLSNAILEAMAEGIPVVASRAGGNPEVVVHGETGLLVTPGDAAGFASAILSLLRNPERAAAMGKAGRERVSGLFSLDRMVASVERMYQELLSGGILSCRV
jgi:glycosyltransferase involved in cell wall biosynthesis